MQSRNSKLKLSCILMLVALILVNSSVYGMEVGVSKLKKTSVQNTKTNEKKIISYKITGSLFLPIGESAYIDTEVEIGVYALKNKKLVPKYACYTTILKGQKSSIYKLEIPADGTSYGIYYKIGYNDSIPVIYIADAYLTKDGMKPLSSERKVENAKMMQLKSDLKLNLTILGDNYALGQINKILNNSIKPGMNDYEKETAIYEYITKNFTYDYPMYEASKKGVEDSEQLKNINKGDWKTVFSKRTGICHHFAALIKILMNKERIECYYVESYFMGHAWNIVKLNGHFYQLDVTKDLGVDSTHLNFNDVSWLTGADDIEIFRDSNKDKFIEYGNFDSFEYNYKFRKYWEANNLPINQVKYINGELNLPQQIWSTEAQDIIVLQAIIGSNTKDQSDDFMNFTLIPVKKGEHSVKFKLPIVATDKNIILSAQSGNYCMYKEMDSKEVKKQIVFNVEMKEELKGKLNVSNNGKSFDTDITAVVHLKVDNGNPEHLNTDIETIVLVVQKKGEHSVDFSIPVLTKDKPLVLYCEIFKGKDLREPLGNIYYGENESTNSYENSSRIKFDQGKTYDLNYKCNLK